MTLVTLLISLSGLICGIFLIRNPKAAIEMQIKFYAAINWKISPVSLEKELRNTRLMGVFLIVICLSGLAACLR